MTTDDLTLRLERLERALEIVTRFAERQAEHAARMLELQERREAARETQDRTAYLSAREQWEAGLVTYCREEIEFARQLRESVGTAPERAVACRVAWRDRLTGETGRGEPLPLREARKQAREANDSDLLRWFWVEPVDVAPGGAGEEQ